MKDANIILYKNKGDRGDCSNYRGISLHSVVGKLLALPQMGSCSLCPGERDHERRKREPSQTTHKKTIHQ